MKIHDRKGASFILLLYLIFSITVAHARLNGDEFDPIFTLVIDQIKELKTGSMGQVNNHPVRLSANNKLAHAIYHYNIAGESYEKNQNTVGDKHLKLAKRSIKKFVSIIEHGISKNKFRREEVLSLLEVADVTSADIDYLLGEVPSSLDYLDSSNEVTNSTDSQLNIEPEAISTESAENCTKAIKLDGINDWVNIPDLTLKKDFTIEGWFNLAPRINYKDGIFGQEGNGPDIHFSAGRVILYAYGIRVAAKTSLKADTWEHIAITRSGSNLKVYINGVKDATGSWNGAFSIKAIGRGNRGFVKGTMDEIRIWEVARTEDEISHSYKTSVEPNARGLIGYWRFNESDQTISDAGSFANHGSLGATTAIGADDPIRLDSTLQLSENCAGGHSTAPTAINDTVKAIEAGSTISFSATENDVDAEDDLNHASVSIISPPHKGNATVYPDGTITYVSSRTTATTDTLSYIVADSKELLSNEATVLMTITNSITTPVASAAAPVAKNDAVGSVKVGGMIRFTVTNNDVSNNIPLNTASVVIVSDPKEGSATVDAFGTITYLNTSTTTTTDTLTYTVANAAGQISNEAAVTIMVIKE